MMLRHSFDEAENAALVERAVGAVLAAGARTADIAGEGEEAVSTAAMGAAVLGALDRLAA